MKLSQARQIDLYFVDESSFSTRPCVPYAWLPVGKQTSIRSDRPLAYNVLGFLHLQAGHLKSYLAQRNANSKFMVECFDDFAQNLEKPTVVVLDQASYHRSKLFKQQVERWQEQNLFLVYLPPYSPQLNPIEILWRFMKYHWLKPMDYLDKNTLKAAIQNILCFYRGGQYQIEWKKHIELIT